MGADWLFYGDADNVYHPDFFRVLASRLKRHRPDTRGVLSSSNKTHTSVMHTDELMWVATARTIESAWRRADEIPKIQKRRRSVAGGGMQVVSVKAAMNAGGVYVPEGMSKDRSLLTDGQRARSDIQFRRRMGGSIMLADIPPQIHLNHARDKEAGRHLETQR
jgi:hypothetical protein